MGAVRAHAAAGDRQQSAARLAVLNSFWKGKPLTSDGR
jgi:hypothetical protein